MEHVNTMFAAIKEADTKFKFQPYLFRIGASSLIDNLSPIAFADTLPSNFFASITRTASETSIVCSERLLTYQRLIAFGNKRKVENDWVMLRVEGPLDFSLIGILSKLAKILADAGVSIFVSSTFDTDYIMVKRPQINHAVDSLRKAGHNVKIS